jgi:hypothetical protein
MRRQYRTVHELPSFARYLNKVFDFRMTVAALTDSRVDPEIPPAAVFLATFHGFVFRLHSFQQLEAEIAHPAFQNWIGAPRAFRDDLLRYSLCGFSLPPLEAMLVDINRTLKRNKVFDEGRVQGRIVAALDGVESSPAIVATVMPAWIVASWSARAASRSNSCSTTIGPWPARSSVAR